jgi:hypothetical protein
MSIKKWQIVDDEHALCRECGVIYERPSLADGMCFGCRETDKDRRKRILSQADQRALARAAKDFLGALHGEDQTSKRTGAILDSFFAAAGGAESFGQELFRHWQRVQGKNLTPEEAKNFRYSPKLVLNWAELIMRHQGKDDENKTLDVSSLSEEDLLAALRGLADDLVKSNPEWRRIAVEKAIKQDPSLINVALDAAGKPALEAEATPVHPLLHPDESDFEADPGAEG